MIALLEKFENYWSGGPPELQNAFLVRSIYPMIILTSSYVLFVKFIGPYIMKNRKPIQLRPLIVLYNFSLVAFYLWFMYKGVFFIPRMGLSMFCGSLLQYDKYGKDTVKELFHHVYLLNYLKYIEFLDTIFLVLTKKSNNVTTLHVFHHASLPVVAWLGLRSETSGYIGIFIGLNSIIHIIMYAYYGIAAMGPKYQKYIWWKKYLTSIQIMQFLLMSVYMSVMYGFGCGTSRTTFIFCIVLTILFLIMFTNYYKEAFNKDKKTEESNKNGFKNSNGIKISNEIKNTNGIKNSNGITNSNGISNENGIHTNGSTSLADKMEFRKRNR